MNNKLKGEEILIHLAINPYLSFYRVIKDGSGGVKIVPQADNPYTQATGIQ